jgi:hypothetical protein
LAILFVTACSTNAKDLTLLNPKLLTPARSQQERDLRLRILKKV